MDYDAIATARLLGSVENLDRSLPSTPVIQDNSGNFYATDDMIAAQQPAMYYSDTDRVKYNLAYNGVEDPNSKTEYMSKKPGIYKQRNSDTPANGGSATPQKPKYTEDQIKFFGRAASYLVSAADDFANAALAPGNAKLKKRGYEFTAEQNERMAMLLEKNISDINRAAQMDANVYKMQRSETKAKQKTAMSASGFAVGQGTYKTTLATTDARTNYNIAMRMLKADLQTAETTRKAGTYRAQAEIERGNAKIAEIQGEAAKWNGIVSGVANLVNSGFSFYVGGWGLEGAKQSTTQTTTNSGGKK